MFPAKYSESSKSLVRLGIGWVGCGKNKGEPVTLHFIACWFPSYLDDTVDLPEILHQPPGMDSKSYEYWVIYYTNYYSWWVYRISSTIFLVPKPSGHATCQGDKYQRFPQAPLSI